ncbi:unnamed protein product [Pelagomonas calceolata]|uniref:Uncharacterized protein n=1 Tax=Pelagomonas calceolata TaxID=35677 RepID=A0A8J2T0E1_9STRA|nr:unnamed protein product [Pelagomonas calceolata]
MHFSKAAAGMAPATATFSSGASEATPLARSTPTTTVTRAHPLASSIEGSASTAPSSVTAHVSGAACSTRGVFSREAIAVDAASNAQSSTPPSSDSHVTKTSTFRATPSSRTPRSSAAPSAQQSSRSCATLLHQRSSAFSAPRRTSKLRRGSSFSGAAMRARAVARDPPFVAVAASPFVVTCAARHASRPRPSFRLLVCMASVVVRAGSRRSAKPGIALMSNAARGMHSGSLALRAAAIVLVLVSGAAWRARSLWFGSWRLWAPALSEAGRAASAERGRRRSYLSRYFHSASWLLRTAPCVSAEL